MKAKDLNTTTMLMNVQCQAHFAQDIWMKYSWSFSQGHHVRLQHKQDEMGKKQQAVVFSPRVNIQQILQPLYVKLALQHLSFSQLAVYKQQLLKESTGKVTLLQATKYEMEHTNKTQKIVQTQPSVERASVERSSVEGLSIERSSVERNSVERTSKLAQEAEREFSNRTITSNANETSSWHQVNEVAQFFKQDRFLLSIMDKRKVVMNHQQHMQHLGHVMKSDSILSAFLDEDSTAASRYQEQEGNDGSMPFQARSTNSTSSMEIKSINLTPPSQLEWTHSSVSIVQPKVRMIWHERVTERQQLWNKQQEQMTSNKNEQSLDNKVQLAKEGIGTQATIQRGQAQSQSQFESDSQAQSQFKFQSQTQSQAESQPLMNNQQSPPTAQLSIQRLMHHDVLKYIATHHWKVETKNIARLKKFGMKDVPLKTLKRIEQHFLGEQITFIYSENPVKRKRGRPRKENSQLEQDTQAVTYRKTSNRKSAVVMKMNQRSAEAAVQLQQQLEQKQAKLSNIVFSEATTEPVRFINRNWIQKVNPNKSISLIHFTNQAWKQAAASAQDNRPSVKQITMTEVSEQQKQLQTNRHSQEANRHSHDHVMKKINTKVEHIDLSTRKMFGITSEAKQATAHTASPSEKVTLSTRKKTIMDALIHLQNRKEEQFVTAKWQHKHVNQMSKKIAESSTPIVSTTHQSRFDSTRHKPEFVLHKPVLHKSWLGAFNKDRYKERLNSLKQAGLKLDFVSKSGIQLDSPNLMQNSQVNIQFLTAKLSQKHSRLISKEIDEHSIQNTVETNNTKTIVQKESSSLLRTNIIHRRTLNKQENGLGQADGHLTKPLTDQSSIVHANSSVLASTLKRTSVLEQKLSEVNHSRIVRFTKEIEVRQQLKSMTQSQLLTVNMKRDETLSHAQTSSLNHNRDHKTYSLNHDGQKSSSLNHDREQKSSVSQPLALKRVESQVTRKQVALLVKENIGQRPKGNDRISGMQTHIKKLEEQIKEQQVQLQDARNPLTIKQLSNQIYDEISRKIKFENQRLGR